MNLLRKLYDYILFDIFKDLLKGEYLSLYIKAIFIRITHSNFI